MGDAAGRVHGGEEVRRHGHNRRPACLAYNLELEEAGAMDHGSEERETGPQLRLTFPKTLRENNGVHEKGLKTQLAG